MGRSSLTISSTNGPGLQSRTTLAASSQLLASVHRHPGAGRVQTLSCTTAVRMSAGPSGSLTISTSTITAAGPSLALGVVSAHRGWHVVVAGALVHAPGRGANSTLEACAVVADPHTYTHTRHPVVDTGDETELWSRLALSPARDS